MYSCLLRLSYFLCVSMLFILRIVESDKFASIGENIYVLICFLLLLYPLIHKKVLLLDIRKIGNGVYNEYQVIQYEKQDLKKIEKSIKKQEKIIDEKICKFNNNMNVAKESLEYIEKNLSLIIKEKNLSKMGVIFERFVAVGLIRRGWSNIKYTKTTNDYGADILATSPEGIRYCIQCKKYSKKVDKSAIQEVHSALKYRKYRDCQKALVVTNNELTKSAHILAKDTGVEVWEKFPN